MGASLSVAGYSSKMPRVVVFGPSLYGGMTWDSPYSIVVYEQIRILIGSIRTNDTIGKLLQIHTAWYRGIALYRCLVFDGGAVKL